MLTTNFPCRFGVGGEVRRTLTALVTTAQTCFDMHGSLLPNSFADLKHAGMLVSAVQVSVTLCSVVLVRQP